MTRLKSPLAMFFYCVGAIAILALFGPEDRSLGANVRIVYLHGAWVLTAEIVFLLAGLTGLIGLFGRLDSFHRWSAALGRTGIFFWVTYLPLSLWAMQTNWNGLFLAEPRFRLALTFAVVGLLVQLGVWIINVPWQTSLANVAYILALRLIFMTTANILHPPPSPIFNSGNYFIIGFFVVLNLLSWIAAYFLARWWLSVVRVNSPRPVQNGLRQ